MKKTYDLIVIGGGSAGYAAARVAAESEFRVALIEGGKETAGLCILRGCMPTKALLESAHRIHEMSRGDEFGFRINGGGVEVNRKAIVKRKDALIQDFASYRVEQQNRGDFDFIRGFVSFQDEHQIEVKLLDKKGKVTGESTKMEGKAFIVATGSEVQAKAFKGLDEVGYITSDEALNRKKPYGKLVVLGAGAVACELAQYFSHLGDEVTVIQRSEHLLSQSDSDLGSVVEKVFKREGIKVYTGTSINSFRWKPSKKGAKRKVISFQHQGKEISVSADEILYALGRQPATRKLGLERAGVKMRGSAIQVTKTQRSNLKHLFAAGDVCGPYEVVHIGIEQGEIAAQNALSYLRGERRMVQMDYRLKMSVVFTSPEVATVGMGEKELKEKGVDYLEASYPFDDHGKSMVMGACDGFVKILAEPKRGRILGAQVVGPHASDLIHELMVCMRYGGTAGQLARMPHYHPTLSEIWTYPAEEIMEIVEQG